MNTSKIVGFVQGVFYPVAMLVLAYVIQNLGASGIFPVGIASVITGILSIVENTIQANTGKAMFGMAA